MPANKIATISAASVWESALKSLLPTLFSSTKANFKWFVCPISVLWAHHQIILKMHCCAPKFQWNSWGSVAAGSLSHFDAIECCSFSWPLFLNDTHRERLEQALAFFQSVLSLVSYSTMTYWKIRTQSARIRNSDDFSLLFWCCFNPLHCTVPLHCNLALSRNVEFSQRFEMHATVQNDVPVWNMKFVRNSQIAHFEHEARIWWW